MAKTSSKRSARPASQAARRAIGYIRVSELGGRSGPELHTIDVQRASIDRAAASRAWDLVDVVTEVNRSGADRSRPKFRDAMDRIVRGEADAMVVWKVSRFARDLTQAKLDIDALQEAGADLVAGDEPFDTASPQGRLMLHLLLSFAEYEREVLGEQFDVIKDRVIERGSHLGRVPFGYLKVRRTPRGPRDVTPQRAARILRDLGVDREPVIGGLVPHPQEASLVRRLFELRAAGASLADLQRHVESAGVRDGLVSATQITRTLELRTYLGEVRQGQRVNRDAHEPLVEAQLFASVQRVEKGTVRRALEPFQLGGLVYCAGCSYRMSGSNQLQPSGKRTRVYRCPGRRGTGRCPSPAVMTAANLESVVWERAEALLSLRAEISGAADDYAARLTEIDAAVDEADAALQELASLEMRRALREDWATAMRRLRAEKDELLRERDAVSAQSGPPTSIAFSELAGDLREAALRGAVTAIFVRRRGTETVSPADRVQVVWKGEPVPPLGGPRNRIPPTGFAFPDDLHGDPGASAHSRSKRSRRG